jgi:DNA topoisomerase-1
LILVVAEKQIAARRIAAILSSGKAKPIQYGKLVCFQFSREGRPYMVVPLKGHILDVEFPKHLAPWVGTDLRRLVWAQVEYVEKEHHIIALLRKLAPKTQEIVLATDADREGESIALEALQSTGRPLHDLDVQRATFSAITQPEIEHAFSHLGELNYNLAESANARREIDLIWGAVLTRYLSIASGALGRNFLSAGRVQSPTLALIVKREQERQAFEKRPYWEVVAKLKAKGKRFEALHKAGRIWDKEQAKRIASKKSQHAIVTSVKRSERVVARPVPFDTTAFLRAASALGMQASRAMNVAETLYQKGLISYPRTDNQTYPKSLNLKSVLQTLAKVPQFEEAARKLLHKKVLKPSKGKQSKDHPPIHPVGAPSEQLSAQEWKIYELVCRRFLATLAEDATVEQVALELDIAGEPYISKGMRYLNLGWKRYYPYSAASEVLLPELKKGELAEVLGIQVLQKETQPPKRYSQGTLIKLMASLGLGTKSTRHEIIHKLYARGYISGVKAIQPNQIAFALVSALDSYCRKIIEPDMTAELEREMDLIAAGKKTKQQVVDESRHMLAALLDDLLTHKKEIGSALREALIASKTYGKCTGQHCDGKLVLRMSSRRKRFLGCTNYPKCTITYPLPQSGIISPTERRCKACGAPVIEYVKGRNRYVICVNPHCDAEQPKEKR